DKVIKCYALKMLMLRYEIANLTFNSCKNRLKRLFCSSVDTKNITDPGWYNMKVRYTHSELGEIVGGARVTISRQINELCSEGFLRMINRRAQVNIEKYIEYVNQHDEK
ncbi:MAG: helix-turn-helix domain-containing protein, partial [Angelakisella sp.]